MGEKTGNRLTTFVPPAPSRAMIALTRPINRWLMLAGTPLLRDFPLVGRLPGFSGLCDIRRIDLPRADEARLAAVCGPGKATFIAPNHPEFFTDWMIDKEIICRVAPMAASWATNGVVNGMGRLMQRFWLANNLIAQIPGNAGHARAHSVAWAKAGHGVLLHPEGAVGWHGDWVAPLLPGTAEMAVEALSQERSERGDFEAWIAPVVWKLRFLRDVEPGLHAECAYVERRLGLTRDGKTPAERIFAIYDELLRRDADIEGVPLGTEPSFAARHGRLVSALVRLLAQATGADGDAASPAEALRTARRWQRDRSDQRAELHIRVRKLVDRLQRVLRIGPFAWESAEMTQEQAAGHLKRLRSDWCAGTLRDGFNRYVPRPVGPRQAIIRVPEPIPVHDFGGDAASLTDMLRQRLQEALDGINRQIEDEGAFRSYSNPFFTPGNNVGTSPLPRRQEMS